MEKFYYRRLDVYQNSCQLVIDVYELLKRFPQEERFALCDQLRRASVSIISNIAEGFGRYSNKERLYFLGNANGSLMEVSSQIDLSCRLGYIDQECLETIDDKISVITKQLASLRKRIEMPNIPPTPNTQQPTP